MQNLAEWFRDVLIPLLAGAAASMLLLLLLLVAQRGVRELRWRRLEFLKERFRPAVLGLLPSSTPITSADLSQFSRRHREVIGELVLAQLRLVRGNETLRGAEIADGLGLTTAWRAALESRQWWRIADAALALGLIRDAASGPALLTLLDHHHDQVRAAAIDALGHVGDPSALGALVARLGRPVRYERARVVQALRAFGPDVAEALIGHARTHPNERAQVAVVLADVSGPGAAGALLDWTAEADHLVRAAAWRALATIGLSDRAFYHALKALRDDHSDVRAGAARAVSRTGRADATDHLAQLLDDDWDVAAAAAMGLRRMGPRGQAALQVRADGSPGLGYDLARQVLWESEGR